ncbi:MAG: prolyl oligopeptidase family serine peptidase [Pseudomonadota bacterium]
MRALLALATALFASPAFACGPDTDCMVGERHYRISMPAGHDGAAPVGAIVWAHGYRGSARGMMRNQSFLNAMSEKGLAVIALKSARDDWVLPNAPRDKGADGSVEFNYLDAVVADAAAKFPIDIDRMVMAGFSAGGMMVWNAACARPDLFAGFAAISGTFWLEPPKSCADPVANIIHIHGDNDPTVPLTGRPIADSHQGAVSDSLAMYGAFGNFGAPEFSSTPMFECESQTNAGGNLLEFCLFEGGHSFRSTYVGYAWDRLAAAGKL